MQNIEMKLYKIVGLNEKLKNEDSKLSPTMTVKWEEKMLKSDKHVRYDSHGRSITDFAGYNLHP